MKTPDTVEYLVDQLDICRKQLGLLGERQKEVEVKRYEFEKRLQAICQHSVTDIATRREEDTLGNYAGSSNTQFCLTCGKKLREWCEGRYR